MRFLIHPLFIAAGILLSSLTANAHTPAYFISVDGLQPSLLKTLQEDGQFDTPRGFSWLLDNSLVVERALPLVTSITAPSHVSTITCSPPSRHGIIANEFLQNGKAVSGYSAPMRSEPLWKAAMRQGRKVLALAYVGSDGRNADRSATFGLAYPDPAKLGPGQILNWNWSELPPAKDWRLPSEISPLPLREARITIILNPQSQEKRQLHVLIGHQGSKASEVWVAGSKDFVRDGIGVLRHDKPALDVFFDETPGPGSKKVTRRRTILRLLPSESNSEVKMAVSKTTYNEAYPESFRAQLDAFNLVWPDYSVQGLNLPIAQAVEAQGLIDRFLTDVAVRMVPQLKVDLVLFYQPLLDTIGHELQSRLPLPFRSHANDEISQAFVAGFRQIDQNLSRLLAAADHRTPIALMGDHGMDAIQRMVNVAPLLRPIQQSQVRLLSSGQLLLLYAAPGHAESKVDAVGRELAKKLAALRSLDGQSVLAVASRRRNFQSRRSADYLKEWQYGDALWAFQGRSGNWLTVDRQDRQLYQAPRASGMHGAALSEASMATALLIHGPAVPKTRVAEASLIQAVPTFAQLMGIHPPAQCLGQSLIPHERRSRAGL